VLLPQDPVKDLAFRESIVTVFAARAAAELERMRTERLKNDFLGMVSHEIRTPLAILQATADGIAVADSGASAARSEEHRKKLSEIWSRNLKRLSSVIRNLLDLSRLESDAVRLHIEKFDLAATAGHVVESFSAAVKDRDVALGVECDPETLVMRGDEELITQVLTNLVDNALRFARTRIRVAVGRDAHGHGWMSVWNDGPEIPEHEMDAIFDKFHQVRRPVGGKGYKGVGLGLAICRRDMELHGGTISVSNVDGGVRFDVRIPADLVEGDGGPPNAGVPVGGGTASNPGAAEVVASRTGASR
jgi:signal transduction histidine kinase